MKNAILVILLIVMISPIHLVSANNNLQPLINEVESKVINFCQSFHEHSELFNREVNIIRTSSALDTQMRKDRHAKICKVATHIAASIDATIEVTIPFASSYPVTYNTLKLVEQMLRLAGENNVNLIDAVIEAEDFAFFAQEVPSFFLFERKV